MIFKPDAVRLVTLSRNVEEAVAGFIGDDEIRLEAGGILIGSYRGPHIEICDCTTPMPQDIRKPHLFDRRDPGHQAAASDAWRRSGGTDTFVGEWHTHPVPDPTPSTMDLGTWHSIIRRTPAALVFLIAGSRSVWCGIGSKRSIERI